MTKAELEKDAEEYAYTKHCKKCISHCEKKCILVKDDYETFKQGIEFGYNKANEWHYMKDGDYPKEKGNYLVAWKRTHHVEEYGKWGFDVDLFNADEGYFEGVGDYVIAWKKIVLPELKEIVEEETKELKEENAELKSENQKWKDEWVEQVQKATDEGYARTLQTIQLTKAKDLLLRFIELKNKPCASGHSINMLLYENICVETEQFISEV